MAGLALVGCDQNNSNTEIGDTVPAAALERKLPPDLSTIYNQEAPIPPQCYTRTEGQFNPCYTCHQTYPDRARPNTMGDGYLQGSYDFSELGETNHWLNLFVDRREAVAKMDDQAILDYINQDNYSDYMKSLADSNDWSGPVPYIENLANGSAAFDDLGFAKDGSNWVAFNYKPLPSTFWPTNGSTDDVMVRLPEKFRTSTCQAGESRDVYLANLSLMEMAIKELDRIDTPPLDEQAVCADLDGDGRLATAATLLRRDHYLGGAADVPVVDMLYPQGIEFLHTVRYVGVDEDGTIGVPKRMKEVRYMNKIRFYDTNHLRSLFANEHQEKMEGNLPTYANHGDRGMDNGFGWMVLGFIEKADGTLRPQSNQEQRFCMGCHTTVGTTIDQTFAFPRKVTGAEGWGYIDLKGMPDAPALNQPLGEIAQYLGLVGGGNEFRENGEMQTRWFNEDGSVDLEKIAKADVYELITPSRDRALSLNKAYKLIVEEQSFLYGRDATLAPAKNVFRHINPDDIAPLKPEKRIDGYEIRLDWSAGTN
ncbi:hypothetical protein B5T_00781 [Alloalcanivorax dieselolei B5]|uniref:Uncharacterized protein n=1 Tax=Alcanivorax dieselolei (strain DSM 16502 / CGMCC 1.3690 / MCCC 1A00001 / B-5) TaxID=930169 RepID=K0C949_ALCDB|nr:hypothetical protein [Alloalcanivorax dieselolei]AFT69065.1 hypothetical protein B5T_00781 [Alloalcanivorax dieselolei B5]GGJ82287.1 putative lipoprotein [Alloalcanivorax dieselolei]